ncbi:MAG: glutamine cyclotransferase [Verrucomicrobiales bacterium]|jgi:glutamine cyclotransferase
MRSAALRSIGIAVLAVGAGLVAWAFLGGGPASQNQVLAELAELAELPPPSPSAEDNFPAVVDSAVRAPGSRVTPMGAVFEIVDTIPHDVGAFTQGLEIHDGRLFESTGLIGRSTIRELHLDTGAVLRNLAVSDVFAEGLTIVGDSAVQLTWRAGVAYRYDLDTFQRTDTYTYDGQGWGLCNAGDELIMSNGTPTLSIRDPETFALRSTVDVTFSGTPIDDLNELECVNGTVWANVWKSSLIIEIDPITGHVLTVLNARSLTPPDLLDSSSAVLNGIAYDPSDDTFLLTGKLWPTIYKVRITPVDQ